MAVDDNFSSDFTTAAERGDILQFRRGNAICARARTRQPHARLLLELCLRAGINTRFTI